MAAEVILAPASQKPRGGGRGSLGQSRKPAVRTATQRPVLTTKFKPPKVKADLLVDRRTLLAKLEGIFDAHLSLIVAPAGYGKTTALSAWASAQPAESIMAWLTLDETDNDPAEFLRHLIESVRANAANLDDRLAGFSDTHSDFDFESVAISLLNILTGVQSDILIIIDDFYFVTDAKVHAFLDTVIQRGSPNLHIAICSRTRPAVKLGKARARGEVLEIDVHDLRFDLEESRDLLARHLGNSPDDDIVRRLLERTEGWAAGLKLAATSISGGRDPAILDMLLKCKNRSIQSFFRDEVLNRLPPHLMDFALQTSILSNLHPDLCDAVTGRSDSEDILLALEAQQLFLQALEEPDWFRYHQLLADLLQQLLARSAVDRDELHRRAAAWFSGKGLTLQALQHAFASDDLEFAVGLLNDVALALLETGQGATLLRYATTLPPEIAFDYPQLQLARVYASTLAWQFADARRVLRELRAALMDGNTVDRWRERGLDIEMLQRKLIHREMNLSSLIDDAGRAHALGRQWLEMPGHCTPFEQAVVQTTLIYTEREQLNPRAVTSAASARQLFVEHDRRWGCVWHDCIVGETHVMAGDLDRAHGIFREALATAHDVSGELSPIAAMPALHLADLLYERDQLSEADALVTDYLPLAGRTGMVDQLVAGYYTKARIAAGISTPAALDVLDEGEEIALSREFERLHAILLAERIRLLIAAGDFAEARQAAIVHNLVGPLDRWQPATGSTSRLVANAFAAAQVAIIDNELGSAEQLLRRWLRFFEDRRCSRFALNFSMLLAHAQLLAGETKTAHRTLRSALAIAQPGGFTRVFVDANSAVQRFVTEMQIARTGADDTVGIFHQQIVAMLEGGKPSAKPAACRTDLDGPLGALNNREAEILLMLATGVTNHQLSEELGLTLGTVKWYLQQIYMKLGVNRRSEAVFKARQLGLMG